MSAAGVFSWLADVSGWLAVVQLGGTVVLTSAFALTALLARRSVPGRIAVRRGAIASLLLLGVAAAVTPWHWSLPIPDPGGLSASLLVVETERADDRTSPGALEGSPVSRKRASSRIGQGLPGGYDPSLRDQPTPLASGPTARDLLLGSAVAVWAAGATGILLYLVAGLLVLRRHARRAEDVTDRISLPVGTGVQRSARILAGGPYRVPICFGLRRATVLIPSEASGWPPERLRAVLLHELVHVECRDPGALLRTRLACALYWCNPLVWKLSRALDVETDARCDERVVRSGVSPAAYARTLVDLAVEGRRTAIGAALHLARRSTLSWRVERLFDPPQAATAGKKAGLAIGCLLLVGSACASARVVVPAVPAEAPAPAAYTPAHRDGPALETGGEGAAPRSGIPVVRVVASPDANEGGPLRLEVVVARTDEAVERLMDTDAGAWFARSPGTPGGTAGRQTLVALEIRPGECTVLDVPGAEDRSSAGLFLFAAYPGPGQHRVRLDWLRSPVVVELRRRGLNASDEAPGGPSCPGSEPVDRPAPPDSGLVPDVPPAPRPKPDPGGHLPAAAAFCRSDATTPGDWTPADLPEAVSTLLEEPEPRRRTAAARAIPILSREAIPSGRASGRQAGDPGSAKGYRHALEAGASDPDPVVRLAAICGLGEVGDEAALEVLGWRTGARERIEVRRAAAWAAQRIRERANLRP